LRWRQGKVLGLRKKRNPEFQNRVKVQRGENMVVKKRMGCCGKSGTEGLEALIKFRTQSPCFKENSLNVLREEALSDLYFWK
jgi:hypothetical protein